MEKLLKNIRFYVLVFSILLSIFVFFWVKTYVPTGTLQIIKLTQLYALISITYLYFTFLAGPFCYVFRWFPWRAEYYRSRRALGVSAFYFGLLHASFAFFGQLGGFAGLGFLSNKYLLAITLSAIALVIFFLMAATSFDFMVDKLTFPKWKFLHRFGYLAGILVLIHAVMLGTHFQNLFAPIPKILFVALVFLMALEANRLDAYLQKKFANAPRFGISLLVLVGTVGAVLVYVFLPKDNASSFSFGIHAQHIQLAKQSLQGLANSNLGGGIAGLNGDRTKRFTASFIHSDNVQPNQDTVLKFRIFDASSGNAIKDFLKVYAYPMHLMIVDSTLSYFEHIHPTQQNNEFDITTQFPKPGFYHLYIQFQPLGGIEQQMAFTLPVVVNETDKPDPATHPVDINFTKTFENYEVALNTHGTLRADDMTLGKNKLTFTIKDAKTKVPITTLKPFMASFGHLTMINEQTYDFIHVHPYSLFVPPPDSNGGPTVDFLPIGIYGPFKPGIYRAFAEFSTKVGTDFDADFTIDIK